MAESLFDIFKDHHTKQAVRNVSRQAFSNENMGKAVHSGPVKRNDPKKGIEPLKKGSVPKKSFLCNAGKSIQTTPMKSGLRMPSVFSGKNVNTQAIYSDDLDNDYFQEIEFTKPKYQYDDLRKEVFDFYMLCDNKLPEQQRSAAFTPPPKITSYTFEYENSYDNDDLFADVSKESLPYQDDTELPSIF